MSRSHRHCKSRGRQRGGAVFGLLVLLVLLGSVAAGMAAAWFTVTYLEITIAIRDQPTQAIIAQQLTGRAEVQENLQLNLKETIRTQVPIDQEVTIPIRDELELLANFDGAVPLKLNVRVQDSIALRQVVEIDTEVEAFLPELGSTIRIPLKGKVPIDTVVPIDLQVPVDDVIQLKFTTPVRASIDQRLTVPLQTVIDAEVPVDASLSVPLLNDIRVVAELPSTPTDAVIVHSDLTVPLRALNVDWVSPKDREESEE